MQALRHLIWNRVVPLSNLSWTTDYPDRGFMVFHTPTKQMLEQYVYIMTIFNITYSLLYIITKPSNDI